ncbi:MAG TPA: DUF4917 family protein [Candidatus Acidoferrales bacterium]|nr:DUF4917 family protein [Candidatus Acidoferrales bacterium]
MGVPIGPVALLTFDECLAQAEGNAHVLLGNGFSRACRDDIFAYNALFQRADFSALPPTARDSFNALGTTDFEIVIRALRTAQALVRLYAPGDDAMPTRLSADADGIRNVLASAIAQNHPERPGDIAIAQYEACRTFLQHFHLIYTLNYDLLLYWALMQAELEPELTSDDGFRTPDEGDADHVTWDVEKTDSQNIFYLHGALHLYDAGAELQKYTWSNTGIALIDQIRAALAANLYPLIVAEGTSEEKMSRILHSNYLSRGYRSFAKIKGNLFVYGHAMGDNDDHWYRLIEKGGVKRLFVAIFGDPGNPGNRALIAKSLRLPRQRSRRRPLEVTFFDSATARVWG